MSSPLMHTCAVCGAEEPLDALLLRMIDDDTTHRLIDDLLASQFAVGGLVIRYLRLHKPAKQALRMSRVRPILAELVPDIKGATIKRAGRSWHAPAKLWSEAFAVVFDAQEAGKLRLPLTTNAYLYEVLMRLADRTEGQQERAEQRGLRPPVLIVDDPLPEAHEPPAQRPPPPGFVPRPEGLPNLPAPTKLSAERQAALDAVRRGTALSKVAAGFVQAKQTNQPD